MSVNNLVKLALQFKFAAKEPCFYCEGKGCHECNGTGVEEKSTDIIEEPLLLFLRERRKRPKIETSLERQAAKKSKEKNKKKLDPRAKVRNRGDVVFPAESSKVKDHKDHYKVNTIEEAHAALSYAGHYSKAPPWFNGTLEELKSAIRRKVKAKFPSIAVSEPKKKSKK
jgi:hypothetical protein